MLTKKWFQASEQEAVRMMESNIENGLNHKEVVSRQRRYGLNVLTEGEKISPFVILLNQFKDFMVLVLLVATLISGLLGEYIDAIAIIAIVVLNGILGFFQEFRAEKSLRALKELTAPTANVIRDGKKLKVAASELVPGDIVLLASGDRIPADLRLVKCKSLHIEESALTGESVPVLKHEKPINDSELPLGDRINMAFMGTLVVQGSGQGVVVETGMNTEMGKIAHLLDNTESAETPLSRRLEHLGKILIVIALILTAIVVITGIWHGQPAYTMFLAGVSLAVAAIPEGLPAIVTIALALGVQRMIKRRAIVRKLPSVETLGCASVICSDKTGTLTQNKMTVTQMYLNGECWSVSGVGYQPMGAFIRNNTEQDIHNYPTIRSALELSVLCNNATLNKKTKKVKGQQLEEWEITGDPTEGALIVLAAKGQIVKEDLLKKWKLELEKPFDSKRKMMSTIFVNDQGKRIVAVKGAPEVLLSNSVSVIVKDRVLPLTEDLRAQYTAMNDDLASKALRVIAIAYKEESPKEKLTESNMEQGLIFMGLFGMIDPPRDEVLDSIQACKAAGVKVVMITGDHKLTAETIAKQIGIIPEGGLVVTGTELNNMSDEEIEHEVDNVYVYARVSPEHKLRIVQALQKKEHVVAMTGDGVNDAPAIKAANIGIAMGITGTDVAKEASSLVLADDNFATIKSAIEEGRSIYDNIRKFIRYLLASNVGEILVMFFAMLLALPLPLIPLQILWVNLVTDGLPALALGLDQPEHDTMKHPPRNSKESLFARGLGWKIISRGFLIGVVTLWIFIITLNSGASLQMAQTMAFSTLVMAQLIHVFDCRSEKSVFHRNPLQNRPLLLAVFSSFLLLIGVIYWEPAQLIFKTVDLSLEQWMWILLFSAIPTFLAGVLRLLTDKILKREMF